MCKILCRNSTDGYPHLTINIYHWDISTSIVTYFFLFFLRSNVYEMITYVYAMQPILPNGIFCSLLVMMRWYGLRRGVVLMSTIDNGWCDIYWYRKKFYGGMSFNISLIEVSECNKFAQAKLILMIYLCEIPLLSPKDYWVIKVRFVWWIFTIEK